MGKGGHFGRANSQRDGRRASLAIALVALFLLGGCASRSKAPSDGLFLIEPEDAANKAIQTRLFETADSDELLSASAAVLQDLGFQITESARDLGFLRGAKERSAREYDQEIGRGILAFLTFALSVFGGQNVTVVMPVDLHQQINASMIAMPVSKDETRHEVRVLFYRLVWKTDGASGNQSIPPGEQKMEMIRDAEIYQQFFARLSKAVFLEAHKI